MAEIINLRQARKRKARAEKEKAADENRRLHGLSKAEKTLSKTTRDIDEKRLNGHRLGDADSGDE